MQKKGHQNSHPKLNTSNTRLIEKRIGYLTKTASYSRLPSLGIQSYEEITKHHQFTPYQNSSKPRRNAMEQKAWPCAQNKSTLRPNTIWKWDLVHNMNSTENGNQCSHSQLVWKHGLVDLNFIPRVSEMQMQPTKKYHFRKLKHYKNKF